MQPQPPPQSSPQAPPQEQPQQGGGVMKLVTGINTDLLKFKELLEGAGIPPEVSGKLDAVIQGYQGFIQEVQGAAQAPAQQPVAGQAVPPQAPPQAPAQAPAQAPMRGPASPMGGVRGVPRKY